MAGHSKFKNIMHRKGAQDKKRAAAFSKLAREITVAAKSGLPDPAMNARLRAAVITARAGGMPKDNIERSINKASASDAETYEEIRYEGFADDIKDVYAESKSNGYDTKTMRKVVALRRMESHVRQEADALLETYRNALGLG